MVFNFSRKPQSEQICSPEANRNTNLRSRSVLHVLRHFARDKSGSYMIIGALVMPVLVGAAGLGTEAGYWMHQQQKMQDAADSAAVAAATTFGAEALNGLTSANTRSSSDATAVAASYGFAVSSGNSGTSITSVTTYEPPNDGPNQGRVGSVEVVIRKTYPRLLSAMFNRTPVTIETRSVARTKGGYGCVLALDGTASASVSVQGGVNIQLMSCSLYDDSTSASALSGGGSGSLSALSVGVVGGATGTSNFSSTLGIWTGQPPTPDPYADVNVPSYVHGHCDYKNYNNHKSETIQPGVYCNGITFNGGLTVALADGIYIVDGSANNGNGANLQIMGGATVTGNHVSIILTSSSGRNYPAVTINGGANVNIGPCKSTVSACLPWAQSGTGSGSGILFYADRNTPVGTSFKFDGGSGQVLGGAVYVPTGAIDYTGGNSTNTVCTQLIGDTVAFSGNAAAGVNCVGYGVRMWGTGAGLAE